MIIQVATRASLEQMAEQYGCTIKEEHRTIYYPSLDQSFDETFLTVMKGERYCFQISLFMFDDGWVQQPHLDHLFEKYVPKE